MELGPVIGLGARAEVFAVPGSQALKLYLAGTPRSVAELEFRQASAVAATGLPVPGVYEVVEVDGRFGVLYERIYGPTMVEATRRAPWRTVDFARRLAELHVRIHGEAPRDIRAVNLHAEWSNQILQHSDLSQGHREALLHRLEQLPHTSPSARRLCHADLHPLNVIMSSDGPVIIDWVDAVRANPVADVARTVLVLRLFPHRARNTLVYTMQKAWINVFLEAYLGHYNTMRALDRDLVESYLPLLAAMRLREGFAQEKHGLLRMIDSVQEGETLQ